MSATRRLYGWNAEAQRRIDNNECPVCGKPKSEWTRRKDWSCCSPECSKRIHEVYHLWSATRDMVLKRDKVCRVCGGTPSVIVDLAAIDMNGLGIPLRRLINDYTVEPVVDRLTSICVSELLSWEIIYKPHKIRFHVFHQGSQLFKLEHVFHWYEDRATYPDFLNRIQAVEEREKIPFYRIKYIDDTKWVVDHKLPIAMGGPEFDLDNLQLLCDRCNKAKTAEDLGWIARYKKAREYERPRVVEAYLKRGPLGQSLLINYHGELITNENRVQ